MTVPAATPDDADRPKSKRTAGRPTLESAAQLNEDLRRAALALFLEKGYDGATLEAIAQAAGTTKPSLYLRFANKESLFQDVVEQALEHPDWPLSETQAPNLDDLEGALRSIAEVGLRRATHPSMVGLSRMVGALASRFPELAQLTSAASSNQAEVLVALLRRHAATGVIEASDPEVLAEQFLDLVTAGPARLAALGMERDAAAERLRTDVALRLFVRGLRTD